MEEPEELKSLLHYCREVSARGSTETVCSCTGALVQETSPCTTQLRGGCAVEVPVMIYATSLTTRGETQSSKGSTAQQGCPAAGWQEFCHLLNASSFSRCRPTSAATPVPQAALSPGVRRTCTQVRAQVKDLNADARRQISLSGCASN